MSGRGEALDLEEFALESCGFEGVLLVVLGEIGRFDGYVLLSDGV